MKKIVIALFFIMSLISIAAAEEIDGPANVRLSPKGDIALTLNDGITVRIVNAGDWFQIDFDSVIEKSALSEGNVIANTILKDVRGNEIGKTLKPLRVTSFSEKEGKLFLTLTAYTFKDNIRQTLTIEEYKIAANTQELTKNRECFGLECVPENVLVKRANWRDRSSEAGDTENAYGKKAAGKNQLQLVYPDTGKTVIYNFASTEVEQKPVEIYLNSKRVYNGTIINYPFDEAVKKLDQYGTHWFFEFMNAEIKGKNITTYNGTVILDGVNLNKKYDYKEVFKFSFIKGKPFFFFVEKNGDAKIHYAGKIMPIKYDEILHYACCSDGAFNPESNNEMVWFYAMRNGALYYVEAGVY